MLQWLDKNFTEILDASSLESENTGACVCQLQRNCDEIFSTDGEI